jgi:hypothetical protein
MILAASCAHAYRGPECREKVVFLQQANTQRIVSSAHTRGDMGRGEGTIFRLKGITLCSAISTTVSSCLKQLARCRWRCAPSTLVFAKMIILQREPAEHREPGISSPQGEPGSPPSVLTPQSPCTITRAVGVLPQGHSRSLGEVAIREES